ncbi:Jag N-terminal domain-containing protein [Massilistercora timonensis]|uniref:Jag N-terminal domain-containing protein n=1 Tax=Massilistercora timonensis TaxID=2086584 RepID=UPI0032080420
MDEYITVSAKTLDDAITDALVELGVTSDQLDYIVIEKGSAGFLGIGMKQAVIKARRKKEEPVEAAEPEAASRRAGKGRTGKRRAGKGRETGQQEEEE